MPVSLTREYIERAVSTGSIDEIWLCDPTLAGRFDSFYVVVTRGDAEPPLPDTPDVFVKAISRASLSAASDRSFVRAALKGAKKVWP